MLAVDPASGAVAGMVRIAAYPQDWGDVVPVEAWINTVGTRRDYRGKGVARWLMAETHRRVVAADEGYERAILGVDSENPTGALALYRSQGYEDVRSVTALNRPSLT